jgi:hypothetical protein
MAEAQQSEEGGIGVHPRSSVVQLLPVFGLAAYLACSWTWCIGMYLPVLLVRDYGVAGWAAFAVPNVIGAAAMGWVLWRPGASERLVSTHAAAAASFSVVTILFHVLFVWWVLWRLAGAPGVLLAVASAAAFAWAGRRRGGRLLWLGGLTFALSVATFVFAAVAGESVPLAPGPGELDVLWLLPAFVFGFAFNPYLDLTFHRARQAATTPHVAVAAFTLGFGLLFLLMIVFTLWYAPFVTPERLTPSFLQRSPVDVRWVLAAVAVHMALQTGFTLGLHALELQRRLRLQRDEARRGAWVGLAGLVPLAVTGALLVAGWEQRVTSAYEVGYTLFLSFYGMLFPAYVWLCMVPTPDGHAGPSRRKLCVLAAAVVLAAPFFWLGLIGRHMIWLPPGVAILLLARLALPRGAPEPPGERAPDEPPAASLAPRETWRRARRRVFGRRAG